MKTLPTLIICILFGFRISVTAVPVLVDEFNDDSINASLWIQSTPFGQSSVFEEGGSAVMIARGGLQTVVDFPDAIEISGRFRLTHPLDNIKLAFRSDLTTTSSFAELSGLIVEFNAGGGTFIAPGGGSAASIIGHPLSTYTANLGSFHDFRIVDDGLNIAVFLDGAETPVTWGSTTHRTGSRLGFYNREFSGLRAELDFVRIERVPEAVSTLPLLSATLALLVYSGGRQLKRN